MAQVRLYQLKNKKTSHSVYISTAYRSHRHPNGLGRIAEEHLFISMIRYGPYPHRYSGCGRYRTLNSIKSELKLVAKFPERKKDLADLELVCYNDKYEQLKKVPSLEKLYKEAEAELIIEKLSR